MRQLPPLNQLKAFEACARHLSFKMAAEEIGVTATAISHQIKLLEKSVGQALFKRRPRPLALTGSGEILFPVVRDALDQLSAGVLAIKERPVGGLLRITTTNAFAARWLAPRLPQWRKKYPKSRIHVIGTDTVLDLGNDKADIAIRYARRRPEGSRGELLRDRFCVVASPTLLRGNGERLKPRQVLEYPLIEAGWPSDDLAAPTWRRWMERARIDPRDAPEPSLVFQEELHAIEAVIAGHGIGICSDALVGEELARRALVVVSAIGLPGLGFHLVYRDDNPRISAIQAFAAWIRTAM